MQKFQPPIDADTSAKSAKSTTPGAPPSVAGKQDATNPAAGATATRSTQSDYSLSQSSEEQAKDEPFSVAEEVNLDQQSDQARRVGKMSQDASPGSGKPAEGMATSMRRDRKDAKDGQD